MPPPQHVDPSQFPHQLPGLEALIVYDYCRLDRVGPSRPVPCPLTWLPMGWPRLAAGGTAR